MSFELQCQSCQVVGELDEYIEEFECPQCGGLMLPVSNAAPAPLEEEDDEAPTISISRSQVADYKKNLKVAAPVDIGFGGMFTSSSTGPLSKSSEQLTRTQQGLPPTVKQTTAPKGAPTVPQSDSQHIQSAEPTIEEMETAATQVNIPPQIHNPATVAPVAPVVEPDTTIAQFEQERAEFERQKREFEEEKMRVELEKERADLERQKQDFERQKFELEQLAQQKAELETQRLELIKDQEAARAETESEANEEAEAEANEEDKNEESEDEKEYKAGTPAENNKPGAKIMDENNSDLSEDVDKTEKIPDAANRNSGADRVKSNDMPTTSGEISKAQTDELPAEQRQALEAKKNNTQIIIIVAFVILAVLIAVIFWAKRDGGSKSDAPAMKHSEPVATAKKHSKPDAPAKKYSKAEISKIRNDSRAKLIKPIASVANSDKNIAVLNEFINKIKGSSENAKQYILAAQKQIEAIEAKKKKLK